MKIKGFLDVCETLPTTITLKTNVGNKDILLENASISEDNVLTDEYANLAEEIPDEYIYETEYLSTLNIFGVLTDMEAGCDYSELTLSDKSGTIHLEKQENKWHSSFKQETVILKNEEESLSDSIIDNSNDSKSNITNISADVNIENDTSDIDSDITGENNVTEIEGRLPSNLEGETIIPKDATYEDMILTESKVCSESGENAKGIQELVQAQAKSTTKDIGGEEH